MSDFSIRPASARDSADLAILENMASRGLAQWFWQGAVNMGKAQDAFQWGRDRLMNGSGQFGWFNSTVAERDEIVLGAAMFYLAEADEDGHAPEPFVPVAELRQIAIDDWYLDSIAVYPSAQGTGVGASLFDNFLAQGRKIGVKQASLIAEDSNETAIRLYESRGFVERDRRPFKSFGMKSNTKNWLLLSSALN